MPGPLKTYTYTNREGFEVSLRLTEADAKARGLTGSKKTEPDNKARTPRNKGAGAR